MTTAVNDFNGLTFDQLKEGVTYKVYRRMLNNGNTDKADEALRAAEFAFDVIIEPLGQKAASLKPKNLALIAAPFEQLLDPEDAQTATNVFIEAIRAASAPASAPDRQVGGLTGPRGRARSAAARSRSPSPRRAPSRSRSRSRSPLRPAYRRDEAEAPTDADAVTKATRAFKRLTARAKFFTCPISGDFIVNAVLLNGQRYDCAALMRYNDSCTRADQPCKCPVNRTPLQIGDIVPDPQFAQLVEELVATVTEEAAEDTSPGAREQWADLLDDCARWTQARTGAAPSSGPEPVRQYSYSEPEPMETTRLSSYSPTSPSYHPPVDPAESEDDETIPTTPIPPIHTGTNGTGGTNGTNGTGGSHRSPPVIELEDSDDEQASGATGTSDGASGPSDGPSDGASGSALLGCFVSYKHEPDSRVGIVTGKEGTAITLLSFTGSIIYAQGENIQPAPVKIYDTVKIISGPLAHKTGVLRALTGTGEGVVVLADSSVHDPIDPIIKFVPLDACAPILSAN